MAGIKQQIHFCASANGVRIAYATSGTGPPLISAANWLTHREQEAQSPVWRHWLEELSRANTLVRYDKRGCGLVAPAGTPRDVVAKLNAETLRSMALPEVRDRALATGAEPVTGTPDEFVAFIATEIPKWERVVKASGAKAN